MAGMIRTFKRGLEYRIKRTVPPDANILTWLVEHCGQVYNKYKRGKDGKTPWERLRGKASNSFICEFGETSAISATVNP